MSSHTQLLSLILPRQKCRRSKASLSRLGTIKAVKRLASSHHPASLLWRGNISTFEAAVLWLTGVRNSNHKDHLYTFIHALLCKRLVPQVSDCCIACICHLKRKSRRRRQHCTWQRLLRVVTTLALTTDFKSRIYLVRSCKWNQTPAALNLWWVTTVQDTPLKLGQHGVVCRGP